MEVWTLVVVYVLVFALLQVVVYRYLRRGGEGQELFQTSPPADASGVGDATDRSESDERVCPHCGTANEPDGSYSYCRNCVRPLGR